MPDKPSGQRAGASRRPRGLMIMSVLFRGGLAVVVLAVAFGIFGLLLGSRRTIERDENAAAIVVDRWNDAARAFGDLKLSGDQLRAFASIPGSDDEPWDVMLQTMALDETSALKLFIVGRVSARRMRPVPKMFLLRHPRSRRSFS